MTYKLIRREPTPEILSAMESSKAVDDEGEFPSLSDLIDFSGQNKTRAVLAAAFRAAIDAAPQVDGVPQTNEEGALAARLLHGAYAITHQTGVPVSGVVDYFTKHGGMAKAILNDRDFGVAAPQPAQTQVDWVGLALDLEQQAKRVESQTAERVMLVAAHGLRLMGAAAPRQAPYSSPFTTDVPQCCESPETCSDPCAPQPAQSPLLKIVTEAINGALDQPETPEAYDAMMERLIAARDALARVRPAQAQEYCDGSTRLCECRRFKLDASKCRDAAHPQPAAQEQDVIPYDVLLKEVHLLEEVCAFYANDEDQHLEDDGEPYGSIPTEVGLKARSARKRFIDRERAARAHTNEDAQPSPLSADDARILKKYDLDAADMVQRFLNDEGAHSAGEAG